MCSEFELEFSELLMMFFRISSFRFFFCTSFSVLALLSNILSVGLFRARLAAGYIGGLVSTVGFTGFCLALMIF